MQKLRNSLFLVIALFSILSLTGCTNSNATENLENFYYVMAIGIDTSPEEKISLSVQVASNSEDTSSSSSSSQSNSSVIYTVPCNSIDSGITTLNNYLSKKLNLSHCAAIIFSEELSKTGIKEYINTFGSNTDIRPTCNIIISNTTSLEALEKISNSSERFSSKFYEFIQTTAEYTGYSLVPELSEFLYCLNYGSNSAIATYAYVSDKTIQNTGIAIFDGNKLIGNLSVLDSIAYSLITNRLDSSVISIKNPNNPEQLIDISVKQIKDPKETCHLVNNYPFIEIDLTLEYGVLTSPIDINTAILAQNNLLEETINSYVQKMILNFLYEASHRYNVDICNFRNQISKKYLTSKEFEKIHWNEIYKESFFKVNINGRIKATGTFSKE